MEAFHKQQYADLPIRAAWVKMLDDGLCMCSPATVFRVLDERKAKARLTVRRARPQRRPPVLEGPWRTPPPPGPAGASAGRRPTC